ncbi:PilZ domain-containing protein [Lacrimispora sp.]|uniref:PilZ domain-containing protein n=1 Tax=Lacrimispora sp. TaxID=2719234 RepID=UPI0028B15B58|nr:PilZ domain-containing protein [Lacrimispora sp.]
MFTECKKACICSFAGNLLAEVEVVDSDKERIGLIIEEEDVRKLSADMIIVFYDGIQGLVTCKCRLYEKLKLEEKPYYMLSCRIMERIEDLERRHDAKVKVDIPVVLEMAGDDETLLHISAVIKNISSGGIGFESKEELKERGLFSFLMDTNFGCVRLKGCVLWKKERTDENGKHSYRYGGHFHDMTSHQESVLERYLLIEKVKEKKP